MAALGLSAIPIPVSTDYYIPSLTYKKIGKLPYQLDRIGTKGTRNAINMYTKGSKLDGKIGGGVFSPELEREPYFQIPEHFSVYQTKARKKVYIIRYNFL